MATETIELEEDRGAAVSEAIHGSTKTVGLVGAINGRKIVGVVVETPDPDEAPAPKKGKAK